MISEFGLHHNLVSVSGGKDSTATLLVAIERGAENISGVFCDTGNEHQQTYDYIAYLQDATGIQIKTLKQDFTEWWWRRREYVCEKWPAKLRTGRKGKWKWRGAAGERPAEVPPAPILVFTEYKIGKWEWQPETLPMTDTEADDVVARALSVYDMGPTGNPFLDLCIIKNRFPSRKAQFCTQFLKTEPATEYALELMADGSTLTSWQGIRAEESLGRAAQPEYEDRGGGYSIYRPIHQWTVAQVFDIHRKHNIKPNPLYLQGMGRVGCLPCINAKKDEVLEISKRFPEHIDRIEEWERIVGLVSKRSNATFFPAPGDNIGAWDRGNIRAIVQWSKTQHGGRKADLFRTFDESPTCASSFGLCE